MNLVQSKDLVSNICLVGDVEASGDNRLDPFYCNEKHLKVKEQNKLTTKTRMDSHAKQSHSPVMRQNMNGN